MLTTDITSYDDIAPASEALAGLAATAKPDAVRRALNARRPDAAGLAALLSPAADACLEQMAQAAQRITRRHFGRAINLYAPLYISNYCSGGCAYCGFAADRRQPRRQMPPAEMRAEMEALRRMGFDEVLLLTGERTPEAGFDYLQAAVAMAAERFHMVNLETFPMRTAEYRALARAGAVGVTVYQETYHRATYLVNHRWGPKRNYRQRLLTPERALKGGMRLIGMGVLLGLAEPVRDALSLYLHLRLLQRQFWRAGFTVSFPRLRPEVGGFTSAYPVDDRLLARMIWAFRICLPDVPLVLSTRETPALRDAMAGIGISKMSVASRTTVGGYHAPGQGGEQFQVSDQRNIETFCAALRARQLEPVFKNWDRAYRPAPAGAHSAVP